MKSMLLTNDNESMMNSVLLTRDGMERRVSQWVDDKGHCEMMNRVVEGCG